MGRQKSIDQDLGCWDLPGAARFDFDIQFGMGTRGLDTSHQFGERLHIHGGEHGAKGWRDCLHCYAMDLRQGNCDGLMNYVVDRIGTSESIVYTCSQGRPHYVFDPSGWGIQLDMQTSVSVPGCSSEFLTSSPWCGAGTCDSQVVV